jgi:D-serine deaminase-like pyridoxal phosphate-dependent protein
MGKLGRRAVLAGGGLVALAGIGTLIARPEEKGSMHNSYFAKLSGALQRAGLSHPVLVIDRTRLDKNIAAIRKSTESAKLPLRVVAKSLPAPMLLDRIMQGMASDRLMLFSAEMLLQVTPLHPGASYLMGKPLPVQEFIRFADKAGGEAAARIQWLIDTPARLAEYAQAAKARNIALRASFEIDVGLHRGGFADYAALGEAARRAAREQISIAGLMGYDPHVPKMPDADGAYAASQAAYKKAIDVLTNADVADVSGLTLNGAGSPSFRRHCVKTVANEVSVGSAFVKPGDFDLDDLNDLQPAAFIATPVLKRMDPMELPGVESLSGPMQWFDRNTKRGYFYHGGHWLAKPESPSGLQYSSLFGRSSNQELVTSSQKVDLKPGDTLFFRPDQSEALFLQFGDIAVYDGTDIVGRWPTLPVST